MDVIFLEIPGNSSVRRFRPPIDWSGKRREEFSGERSNVLLCMLFRLEIYVAVAYLDKKREIVYLATENERLCISNRRNVDVIPAYLTTWCLEPSL